MSADEYIRELVAVREILEAYRAERTATSAVLQHKRVVTACVADRGCEKWP